MRFLPVTSPRPKLSIACLHSTRRSTPKALQLLLLALAISACDQSLSEPVAAPHLDFSTAVQGIEVKDLPAVDVQWVDKRLSDDALVATLERVDGWAIISFKAEGSERLGSTVEQRPSRGGSTVAFARKPPLASASIRAGLTYLERAGITIVDYLPNLGAVHVVIDEAEQAVQLRNSPFVDYIAPRDFAYEAAELIDWGIDTVRARDAWSSSNGAGAKVLIIDDGHDRGREDLPLVPLGNCAGPWGGCSPDDDPHGTMVLGALTMRYGNGVGGAGAAPGIQDSDVYVYSACGWIDPDTYRCVWDEMTKGIDQGISWGVDVINISISGEYYYTPMAEAVARAESANVVIVASAGNTNTESFRYPAGFETVLGVSGIVDTGEFAFNSNTPCLGGSTWGNHVSLSAPFDVYTTVRSSSYYRRCGTSFSAPLAAGAAAIVRALDSSLTAQEVRSILTGSAVDHGPAGWDKYFGHGVLDIAGAVASVYPLTVSISGPFFIDAEGYYTWEAMPSGGLSPYTYQWEIRYDSQGMWGPLGSTSKEVTFFVEGSDGDFDLRVTTTDAADGSVADQHSVTNTAGCSDGQIIC